MLRNETKPSAFQYFKPPKNGNLKALNGRLTGQPTSSKSTTFDFNNIFFINDSIFITDSPKDLKTLMPILIEHFKRLGMQMHLGNNITKSKMEANFWLSNNITE